MSHSCCAHESTASAKPNTTSHNHESHGHHDDDGHGHAHAETGSRQIFLAPAASFLLLVAGLVLDHYVHPGWFSGWLRAAFYLAAYLPVGLPVLRDAFASIRRGDIFSEFFLMGIATVGAFGIGEYPEGVAVMLFYSVGELFQGLAVSRARNNIKSLLDQRPDEVTVLEGNSAATIRAENAEIGQVLQLKPGEKLALDGVLLSETALFNTAALTGESKPQIKRMEEPVYAGMINLNAVSRVRVTTAYRDSKLSKILALVQDATAQKAPTELFIRKFAKVYTPVVFFLALGICLLPYFFVKDYQFHSWLYRALVFLVVSCPCALVISIPLGYFGGIGAGSRNGILFKGGNYLDILAKVKNVVVDKTGTMTAGVFRVQKVIMQPGFDESEMLGYLNFVESKSTHPIATAVRDFVGEPDLSLPVSDISEIPGHGMRASIGGAEFLAGNAKLMSRYGIEAATGTENSAETVIAMALGGRFAGYLSISDEIKEDAPAAVAGLSRLGVGTTMLSGDRSSVVADVAQKLGIAAYFGDLLPEDKVQRLKEIKAQNGFVAFVGDGVNDAPVVALSDAGIAMGGLGSDATVETADVVIQDDRPSKIPMAIRISRATRRIVWQNIILAFAVKAAVLILGAGGIATMWEAVFADVGVALLAILNAVRIQNMDFNT